jgi:DNA-binding NarL/FixJ family response regulator
VGYCSIFLSALLLNGPPKSQSDMKNVLIVDDSWAVRNAVRFVLEKENQVTVCGEAEDGFDALRKAAELKPDLILLDLAMPKLDGALTAWVLKRISPEVPIILFTMYETAVDALAPAIGVEMVLSKPDGFKDLVRRVQELLCRRTGGL